VTARWASGDDPASPADFRALHAGLTVYLIATPRDQLMTCAPDERLPAVAARNTEPYDYLPVVQSDGLILGLFRAADFHEREPPDDPVSDHMLRLTEDYAIGGDASILDFLLDADDRPCRLVFSGAKVSGLVSLSDLQKLPVRAALFALITGLEITMADAIRSGYGSSTEWAHHLSEDRRGKIEEQAAASRAANSYVDHLLFTQFCDKRDIIAKALPKQISKTRFREDLKKLEKLRDNLAHANEYAATREAARDLSGTVRTLLDRQEEIAALFR
jgi:hypothetical protein